ncbi:DUF4265 domain-containing protein [Asticcacaulis sp. AC402]|uniref:DUF4265 domain-containing protein n=1 Tax=Asticcacaulis sp. AC402 TaxID=1282361 RepID=UPI00138AE2C8|nr:DUF4265 domain-containing protein [Asticcacaulis sp. AC402]
MEVDKVYPPISVEILNGYLISENIVEIDNTPFFIQGIAVGYKIFCESFGDSINYRYLSLKSSSGRGSVSIIFVEPDSSEEVYQRIRAMGLYSEYGEFPEYNMLAVSAHNLSEFEILTSYLSVEEAKGRVSYAELCLPDT